VGLSLSGLGSVAGLGASHATGNGQKVAYQGVQALLALEVAEEAGSSSYFQGHDGSHTKAQ